MAINYPIDFVLENGTHVIVNSAGENMYDFALTPPEAGTRHFTYADDERTKEEKDAALDFEQLDALRTFWLAKEEAD